MTTLNGRPVIELELAGIIRTQHPEYEDAHFESAVWGDTGEQLTDEELEELSADGELVGEMVADHLQGAADFLHDLREGK